MQVSRELQRGSTSIMVLSLLERESMYGYQLIKELERVSGGVFHLKEGTLYPILHSLERDGLVSSYWQDTDSKRRRKYYLVTDKGRKALRAKTKEWGFFKSAVDRVLGGEMPCLALKII